MNLLAGLIKLNILLGLAAPLQPPAYLGPDTLVPLGSVLAAILGFLLMFWRLIYKFFKKVYRKIRGLSDEVPPDVEAESSLDEEKDK